MSLLTLFLSTPDKNGQGQYSTGCEQSSILLELVSFMSDFNDFYHIKQVRLHSMARHSIQRRNSFTSNHRLRSAEG
nr:hypothetical protein CFP56_77696 [Quercus suber]